MCDNKDKCSVVCTQFVKKRHVGIRVVATCVLQFPEKTDHHTIDNLVLSNLLCAMDVHQQQSVALFFVVLTVIVVSSALFSCMIRAISVNYRARDSSKTLMEENIRSANANHHHLLIPLNNKNCYFSDQVKWEQDIIY